MSVKRHTHIEISTYLNQVVEALEFVDKYKGQLDDLSNFVFPKPAVFISFGRFEWRRLSGGSLQGLGIIKVRVVCENYADSFTGSVDQEKALAFFDINEEVHKALEGLSGTYFSALTKVVDEDDEDHKSVIATYMEYETTITDNSAHKKKSFILTDPEVNVQYQKNENMPEPPEPSNDYVVPVS